MRKKEDFSVEVRASKELFEELDRSENFGFKQLKRRQLFPAFV